MNEAGDGELQRAAAAEARVAERLLIGRRGWYVARMVAFGCVLVWQLLGLAGHRTGDLVRLRVAVIVLAGVFLVATTVDYVSGRKVL